VTTGRTAIDKTHTRQSEMVTTVVSAIDKIHTAAGFICVSVRSQIWVCNSGQMGSTRQGGSFDAAFQSRNGRVGNRSDPQFR
jgi:hypothetical protein